MRLLSNTKGRIDMSTPYADSGVPINSTIYDQVTSWQGATPDGWGRYLLAPSDNGQSAGNGITWYSGANENAFFNSKQMRLLPIAGQGITVNDYNTGVSDATNNLNAVLKALSNKATNFPSSMDSICAPSRWTVRRRARASQRSTLPTIWLAGCSRWQPASRIRWAIN